MFIKERLTFQVFFTLLKPNLYQGNVKMFMKKKAHRIHRIHRRAQNFFCHNLSVFFLCFSVCSVGN